MFLNKLIQRNPEFIKTVTNFHQAGEIPPNSYVLDLDTIQSNAQIMFDEAKKLEKTKNHFEDSKMPTLYE